MDDLEAAYRDVVWSPFFNGLLIGNGGTLCSAWAKFDDPDKASYQRWYKTTSDP